MTTKLCSHCGEEFEPYGKRHAPSQYICKPCRRAVQNEAYHASIKHAPRNTPVLVVGVDPALECQELRNDLRICFWGSRFVLEDFRRSVQEGCVDGLLVEHAGQRYAVRRGEMVMVEAA